MFSVLGAAGWSLGIVNEPLPRLGGFARAGTQSIRRRMRAARIRFASARRTVAMAAVEKTGTPAASAGGHFLACGLRRAFRW